MLELLRAYETGSKRRDEMKALVAKLDGIVPRATKESSSKVKTNGKSSKESSATVPSATAISSSGSGIGAGDDKKRKRESAQ